MLLSDAHHQLRKPYHRRHLLEVVGLLIRCCMIPYFWNLASLPITKSSPPFRWVVSGFRIHTNTPPPPKQLSQSRDLQQARVYMTNSKPEVMDRFETSLTQNIVVIGGGIQGAAVAYYLSELRRNDRTSVSPSKKLNITILEAVSIAAAASGKGGGFMAKTWGSNTPTQSLHEVAFDLYEQLAATLNCTSYRKLPVLSVTAQQSTGRSYSPPKIVQTIWPDWLDETKVGKVQVMGTGIDTAQITPLEMVEKFIHAAQVQVVYGQCMGIEFLPMTPDMGNSNNSSQPPPQQRHSTAVTGVRYNPRSNNDDDDNTTGTDFEILPADQIIVCAGPWSCSVVDWIRQHGDDESTMLQLPMEGIKSTSIVYPPPASSEKNRGVVDATALFCGEDDQYNTHCT
jgi:hypothetical protein